MARKTLTRRELYDLVWSTPIAKLAVEFGISDVGLIKTCQRHRVPTPSRGYWAKVHAGKPAKKALFVEVRDAELNRIEIGGVLAQLPDSAREIIETTRARQRSQVVKAKPALQEFVAHEPIQDPHKSIARTAKALRKAKPDAVGGVSACGDGLCGVEIGTSNVERAVTLLDSLARRLDEKDLSIEPTGRAMKCSRGPETLSFTLKERTRQELHTPTDEDLEKEERRKKRIERAQGNSSWGDLPYGIYQRAYPDFDTVFTGQLVLQVDGYGDGVRRAWADGKLQRIENLMDSIVAGFEALLAVRKARREEREEWHRQWAEQERRHELAKKRAERETQRVDFLDGIFRTRQHIEKLRQAVCSYEGADPLGSDLKRFVQWVRERLSGAEASLTGEELDRELKTAELFPERDELEDPLGEPAEESE